MEEQQQPCCLNDTATQQFRTCYNSCLLIFRMEQWIENCKEELAGIDLRTVDLEKLMQNLMEWLDESAALCDESQLVHRDMEDMLTLGDDALFVPRQDTELELRKLTKTMKTMIKQWKAMRAYARRVRRYLSRRSLTLVGKDHVK